MSVAMICSNCRHWFAPRGSVAVGKCRRFPATVSTHGQDMCGEWMQVGPDLRTFADVATGPTRTMVAAGPINPGDMVKEVAPGVAEAVQPIVSRTYRGDPVDPLSDINAALERAEALPGAAKAADRIDKAKKGGRR